MARKKPEPKASTSIGEKIAEIAHDVVDAVKKAADQVSAEGDSVPPVSDSDEAQDVDALMADHPKFAKFK